MRASLLLFPFLAACGGADATSTRPPVTNDPTASLPLELSTVKASRTPPPCSDGSGDTTFQDDYLLVGEGPSGRVALDIHPGFDTNVAFDLAHEPSSQGLTAKSTDARHVFALDLRLNPSRIEDRLDRASVTVLEFPRSDGERLTARVKARLEDGRTIDATLSAALVVRPNLCDQH